jgi:carbohydrate kinase (thermoresistant glucokinase family)
MVIILMGVSGCGKSTVGRLLASRLGLPFHDADNFHPKANVEKMRSGVPLTDKDRKPWLENLNASMKEWNKENGAVLACSALKKSYRNCLRQDFNDTEIVFIFLDGSKNLIAERLQKRKGHYMPPDLLDSQFDALEEPGRGLRVTIEPNAEEITEKIVSKLPLPDPTNNG